MKKLRIRSLAALVAFVLSIQVMIPNRAVAADFDMSCLATTLLDFTMDITDCRGDLAVDRILCAVSGVSSAFQGEYNPGDWRECQSESEGYYSACVNDSTLTMVDNLMECITSE